METERVKGDGKNGASAATCGLGVGTPRCLAGTERLSGVQRQAWLLKRGQRDPSELGMREALWEVSPTRQSWDSKGHPRMCVFTQWHCREDTRPRSAVRVRMWGCPPSVYSAGETPWRQTVAGVMGRSREARAPARPRSNRNSRRRLPHPTRTAPPPLHFTGPAGPRSWPCRSVTPPQQHPVFIPLFLALPCFCAFPVVAATAGEMSIKCHHFQFN